MTVEPGREWQVRNRSASCEPLLDGEEEPEGSGRRRMEGQRRAPPGMEAAWADADGMLMGEGEWTEPSWEEGRSGTRDQLRGWPL